MNNSLNQIQIKILRMVDSIRERQRWKKKPLTAQPRIYYGQRHIPNQGALLSGGLVKLQDLIAHFPNHPRNANILYLVSSALPPNPDILVKHAEKAKVPIVLNQNGVAYPAWHGPGWKKTNDLLNSVYLHASFIIFQSAFCKKSAEKFLGSPSCPHSILHNPVDTDTFLPTERFQPSRPLLQILVAGSHGDFYKIKTSLDTLAALLHHNLDFTLQIAGRCCWRSSMEECHEDINNYAAHIGVQNSFTVTGPYTQLEAVGMFQVADILIHPTYNDSCPRLVVEALACGVPVAYSATGGTPELISPKAGIGVAGPLDWNRVVPPDPEKLARAIITIRNNYESFSAGAREHAATNHNVSKWIESHEQIFTRLLASDRPI